MSIFEVMMLVCFGAAWPFNLYNSLRSRTAVGRSLFFLLVVNLGYLSGILHKVLYNNDAVLYLYIVNFLMVSADIAIYCRNRQLDRMRVDWSAGTKPRSLTAMPARTPAAEKLEGRHPSPRA